MSSTFGAVCCQFELSDFSIDKFQMFIDDDLMNFENDIIKVNILGRLVIRNIAMMFDPLLNKGVGSYSKTI